MKKQIITMGIMLSVIAISVPAFAGTQDTSVTATNTIQQKFPPNWNGENKQPPFDFKNGKKPPEPPKDENGNPIKPPEFSKKSATST